MIIDLRSDTVTRPTPAMLSAMFEAKVGDDVFGEDPTITALEEKVAAMFGMEAAIFCPSGTMTNQIALKLHTRPLEEVICHDLCHIYKYEVGSYAYHSGVSLKLLSGNNGILKAEEVEKSINPDHDWLPISSLVCLENTCNKAGGTYYQLPEIQAIKSTCLKHNLKLHLDGARLFNALVESNNTPQEMGREFDTISLCLSKGLGAPVGSLLLGKKTAIRQARRIRKAFGGGMRQAGYLAAACIYALDHNINRLKDDHRRAKILGSTITKLNAAKKVYPIDTNIVIFETEPAVISAVDFAAKLEQENIKAIAFSDTQIRMVTHLDFTEKMLDKTVEVLRKIGK